MNYPTNTWQELSKRFYLKNWWPDKY
jgi:hypothetical protein